MDKWTAIGLVVTIALVAVPVVMIGRLAIAILMAWRDHRRDLAREVTHEVPGLGAFTSTDGELWFGEVQDLQVTLKTTGHPPTEAHAALVRDLLDDLPRLVELSRAYLWEHEDCSRFEGGAEQFEVCGMDPEDKSSFVLEFFHTADDDGTYRVEFENGLPVNSGRDD